MSLTSEAKQEAEQMLRSGDRQGAIQYLNEAFNISLEEAGVLVHALEQEITTGNTVLDEQAPAPSSPEDKMKIVIGQLLSQRQKLEAVKYVRQTMNLGLREALAMVEGVARETDPRYRSVSIPGVAGCLQVVAKGLGVFLAVVAFFFLAAGGIIFYFQSEGVRASDRIVGKVKEMKYMDSGESAPVIEYNWNGKMRTYTSHTYSSPPDYQVGETVPIFVRLENEDADVIIDSFVDRYAVIVGLGIIGGFLGLISIVFLYFGRRRF